MTTTDRIVYLDHAASAPLLPEALAAATTAAAHPGNASSLHGSGRRQRRLLEEARESIARDLGARPSEVVFTGGGTEADNLAVKGVFWSRREADPRRRVIIASAVEHHAIIDTVEWLAAHDGAEPVWLPVDATGRVDPAELRAALAAHPGQVALVTVMWANNEVGTVQPIAELAAVCADAGVPLHSDAVQAVGHLPIDFGASGLSALSLSAHKFGGPLGVGALLIGRTVAATQLLHGGGHERDLRSGTPNVPGAAGMAAALAVHAAALGAETARIRRLRERLVTGLRAVVPNVIVNGAADPDGSLPGHAHVSFPGCEGDSLLMLLDARGIECSTASACQAGVASASHVLLAMGVEPALARGSLRFSLGSDSTEADVDALIEAIGPVVERARAAGMVAATGGR
jgi:cysteine desulfurase